LTPKTVPLLRGAVVVATHDSNGDLDGLSWEQLDLLVSRSRSLTKRARRALGRRMRRDGRGAAATQAPLFHEAKPRTPVLH
jgi:hypothetical protein